MRRSLSFLFALICSSTSWSADLFFPDPKLTPGAVNTAVTQDNVKETVCSAAWLKSIEPPAEQMERIKREQMQALHLDGKPEDYVEDHLIPLCAGGHPTDPANLWPQRAEGDWNYGVKNQFEVNLCRAICDGDLTLQRVQNIFREPDWREAYLKQYQRE